MGTGDARSIAHARSYYTSTSALEKRVESIRDQNIGAVHRDFGSSGFLVQENDTASNRTGVNESWFCEYKRLSFPAIKRVKSERCVVFMCDKENEALSLLVVFGLFYLHIWPCTWMNRAGAGKRMSMCVW